MPRPKTERPVCKVPDCKDRALTLKSGWCSAHYQRAKLHDGDPLGGRARNGEVIGHFRANLMTITDECKVWPYKTGVSANGDRSRPYGQVWIDGKLRSVHVLACEAFNGPMPAPGMDAAHGRDRRCVSTLCWNGAHLQWATRKENMDMQLRDGTRNQGEKNGGARLTEAQVYEIRRLYDGGVLPAELSTRYAIAINHVHQIGRRTRWRYLLEEVQ